MKSLVVLFCLIVFVYGKLPKDAVQTVREMMIAAGLECIDEVGATEADVLPLIRFTIPETEKGKCFIACMQKKFEIMHKDGKIDKAALFKMMDELKRLDYETYKVMKPVVDKCLATVKNVNDECETATNLLKCWYEEGNCGPNSDECIFEFE
ncbi:hypothetical protein FQR65_LT00565 [Abscondita terminalis]|nr:hypothetical protein FQR65_LT00565 [Abscondita terminalis]